MARRIETYKPRIPDDDWAAIGDVVREAERRLGPKTVEIANASLYAVTTFVHWCYQIGLDLEPAEIFEIRRIEEFVHQNPRGLTGQGLSTIRSHIKRVAETYHPHMRRLTMPRSSHTPNRPYTTDEVRRLRLWARSLRTPQRRLNAHVLLALGIGTGCSSPDIQTVMTDHFERVDGQTLLHIGGKRPRVVMVESAWRQVIDEAVEERGPGRYLFRDGSTRNTKNLVSNFVYLNRTEGMVRPAPARLRMTWVVNRIMDGMPLDVLIKTGGFKSPGSLEIYFEHIPDRSPEEHLQWMMRGRIEP